MLLVGFRVDGDFARRLGSASTRRGALHARDHTLVMSVVVAVMVRTVAPVMLLTQVRLRVLVMMVLVAMVLWLLAARRTRRVIVRYGLNAHGREGGARRLDCGHWHGGRLHVHGGEALVERGDDALDARDDLVVGHRQRVHVQTEHLGYHTTEIKQL